MPTHLPPKRPRPPATPPPKDEDYDDTGDTLVPVLLIVMLVLVNMALYVVKFGPPAGYAVAAAPTELQLSP
jgi:hypothetical protein